MGSFLNLCMDRLPKGDSIIAPPSHCPACMRRLGVLDLAPICSYVLLKGQCRTCHAGIPLRVLVVELSTAGAYGLLWQWLGPGAHLVVASLYVSLLILITGIDLEHRRILNRVVYPAMLIAPAASVVYGVEIQASLLGGGVGFLFMLLLYLVTGGGMGAGDVKLATVVGLFSGFPAILVALFAASIAGGVVAAALLITRIQGRKDPIPYAPFISFGALVAFVAGQPLSDWYLNFL